MKKLATTLLAVLMFAGIGTAKKVLDHSSFDDWKSVSVGNLTRNGQWASYAVNPQEGDGMLTIRNTKNGKVYSIPRGYGQAFTADGRYLVAKIRPEFKKTRQAKIDGKKDFDLPQDSLIIIDLTNGKTEKIPSVTGFKLGKEKGHWIAYSSVDTLHIKAKDLKDKKAGKPLVIRDMDSGVEKVINWVKEYTMSEDGKMVAAIIKKQKNDSTTTDGLGIISLPDTNYVIVDRDKPFYGSITFNRFGDKLAYVASTDSAESGTRRSSLYLVDLTENMPVPEEMLVSMTERQAPNFALPHVSDPEMQAELEKQRLDNIKRAQGETLFVNQYTTPKFSHDGRRLIAGVAPYVAPDDTTIVEFERADLDIWRWDAPMTPPQENRNVDNLRKQTFPVVIDLNTRKQRLLTSNPLVKVEPSDRWDGDIVLLIDPTETMVSQQWDYAAPQKLTYINLATGEEKDAGYAPKDIPEISPKGKYVLKYDNRQYSTVNTTTGEEVIISEEIPYPVWDEEQDIPLMREPYGIAGWTDNDADLLVYDRYDIWSLDPAGKRTPINLTNGDGRRNNRRYRYIKTDSEQQSIAPGQTMLISVHDFTDKRNGLATLKLGKPANPAIKTLDTYKFTQLKKAKNADVYAFEKANFSTSPDVWIATSDDFRKSVKVTDANPQMKDYNWGTAELVKWYSYSGDLTEGILYKPEDFDPEKKYPMLVVFYERDSENLYAHYTMQPSWSWVNYPFYVSRGYVVFVPDVKYAPGIPGESAYNYICSGVEELCRKNSWIDKDRIGIDGQSWGGYQTAFLITRSNMFACAGSGAPVANMTSAFGGIRWGSGDSRQAQYEQGQSRIGRNLWEAPELYIANSPIFHADRVDTPLLIMHNDDDGAVPWYQGIELFMALRRLQKPVWMLQYNGEAHNIKARKNRKDITIRLQQFFDHYLKGDPMPEWMKTGIPAIRKGQELRTGLVEE